MNYKQKHPETCLAKCLLILLKKADKKNKEELKLLIKSLKYDRENIARGHLETAVKRYKTKFNWIVDSKIFYNFTTKQKLNKNIQIINEKIDFKKIDSTKKPLIIYIDQYYLWEKNQDKYYKYHYPHFIIILGKKENNYLIIDPNDGKTKLVKKSLILKSIKELKTRIWLSPMIINLQQLS